MRSKKKYIFTVALIFSNQLFGQSGSIGGTITVHQPTTNLPNSRLSLNEDLSASSLLLVEQTKNAQKSIDASTIIFGKPDRVVDKKDGGIKNLALTPANDGPPPKSIASPVTQPPMPGTPVSPRNSSVPPPAVVISPQKAARISPKDSSTAQMPLPGVGVLPGDQPARAQVIRIQENVTEEVPISSLFPNRIATPFPNPRVIDSSDSAIKQDGSNVFISTSSKDPVAIFITSDRSGDPVISLLLKPSPIPPQSVVLHLDARTQPSGSSSTAAQDQIPDTYTGSIVHVLKQIALGQVPAGMAGGPLPTSIGQMGKLTLATESRYSGRSFDVFTYWIENASDEPVVLDEANFYTSQSIRAVSFYPITNLKPKEGTRLMIVSEHHKTN